ncbi:MAG: shikimate dehydrogenase [Lachnospiraceae bacterium]
MQINGSTKTLGVIGCPIEHTRSPIIHNELAKVFSHNVVYVPFHVPTNLGDAIQGAYALGIEGMNVTIPHKTEMMQYAIEIDEFASVIGAANTLVRVEGGYKAYNTDIPGLKRAFDSDGVVVEGEEVIVLGAGGVSRAVCILLAKYGAKRVYVLNRTIDKALDIAKEVNRYAQKELVQVLKLEDYKELEGKTYLCIQATSVGMYPHVEDVLISDDAFYDLVHTGYDLVYNPYETAFIKKLIGKQKRAFHGLKMLLYQGVIAYEYWYNIQIDEKTSLKVYERLKEALE